MLTYGFAYGSTGDKVHGKDQQQITSVYAQPEYYSGFGLYATIHELLRPFVLTANRCVMNYQIPVWMYRADAVSEEVIRSHGEERIKMIDDPLRSNPQVFLKSERDETLERAS